MQLKVLSYNIHKGLHWNGRHFNLEGIRAALSQSGADIVFLQEVVGENQKFARRHKDWFFGPQFERLADGIWNHYSYAKNAVYDHGHHGNVILSRYPIIESGQELISTNRFEQRGILYSKIEIPAEVSPDKHIRHVWLFCVHLNLLHSGRQVQYGRLVELVNRLVKKDEAVVIAGDFNDWNQRASDGIEEELQVLEVHRKLHGQYARTFPAFFPFLCLDRVYMRSLIPRKSYVLVGPPWDRLSDHLPLIVDVEMK